jgi:hypothetical protein
MGKQVKKVHARTGGRNEFIGTPVTSGGEADTSGVSMPNRTRSQAKFKKDKAGTRRSRSEPVSSTSFCSPTSDSRKVKSNEKKKKLKKRVDGTRGRSLASTKPEAKVLRSKQIGAPFDWQAAFDKAITVGQPPLLVPAEEGDSRSRALAITRVLPIPPVHRAEVVKFVREVSWEEYYLAHIDSNILRRLVLKDLCGMIGCSTLDAEKLLQLSYLVYKRFIAGDETEAIEHHAIAMWCGQILFSGNDHYAESDWVHDEVPEETHEDANGNLEELDALSRDEVVDEEVDGGFEDHDDHSRDDERNVVQESIFTDDDAELARARQRMEHPSFVEQEVGAALDRPGADAEEIRRRVVAALPSAPSKNDIPTPTFRVSKSALRSNAIPASKTATRSAAFNQGLLSTPVAHPVLRGSRDLASDGSNSALERVIETLRKKLPKADAEEVIDALALMNDGLRHGNFNGVASASVSEARSLGRTYRIGELAKEQQKLHHHYNKTAARVSSKDAPESELWDSERMALLNPADQDIVATLRKVLSNHSNLNARQKLRVASRLVRKQLAQEALPAKKAKKPAPVTKDKASDDGSGSEGESCGADSKDSRISGETYEKDSFCAKDDSSQSDGGGSQVCSDGGDDPSDSSSDSGSSNSSGSDSKKKSKVKKRRESANSLGTPATKKKEPLAQHVNLARTNGQPGQLVLLGDEDLPMWKTGSSRYKNGFSWESYLHHKQQYDNYKAHRGRFSERTFRSIIHVNLIPIVCASCGFLRSKWTKISDEHLILKIERVLSPSRSTDFAMELKAVKMVREGDEALQASYCTFAEKFLGKIAEAEDAGKPIKSVVIKAAFKAAVDKELPLKTWLEGNSWRGVDRAHARLLRKLREARSWEAMTNTVLKAKHASRGGSDHSDREDSGEGSSRRAAPRRRNNSTRSSNRGTRGGRGKSAKNSDKSRSGKRGKVNNTSSSNSKPRTREGREESRRSWSGLDGRGESWHTDHALFECFKRPCNALFCQRCAMHGHTANSCRVPDGVEGLNSSGYFQEKRPGKVGPKKSPPRSNATRGGSDLHSEDDYGDEQSQEEEDDHARVRRSNNTSRRNRSEEEWQDEEEHQAPKARHNSTSRRGQQGRRRL